MATYILISSNVLSADTAFVDFTSIPAIYTDLLIKCSTRDTRADTQNPIRLTFNGDTSSIYSVTRLGGNGTSASSARTSSQVFAEIYYENSTNSTASTFTSSEFYIPNYLASQNKPTSAVTMTERNSTEAFIHATAVLYRSNTAISSLRLAAQSADFVSGSSFYLYGISNA
jgi:hypothetical protein